MQKWSAATALVVATIAVTASFTIADAKPRSLFGGAKLSGSSTYQPPHFGWCRPPRHLVHGRCLYGNHHK